MCRTRVAQILTLSGGLLVAFGAAGQAFAHGYAHHEAHEHALLEEGAGDVPVLAESPAHDGDHAHPSIGPGSVPRLDLSWDAPMVPSAPQVAAAFCATAKDLRPEPTRPPPRSVQARSTASRAPPHIA